MRNAALTLGLIAGLMGIVVGLIGYGYAEATDRYQEFGQTFGFLDNPGFVKLAAFLAPLLAIAGGAMARSRALWGGVAMLLAAVLFWQGFGFNVGTMFPIGFAGLGGVLAIAAGKPDEPTAHF